MINFILAIYVLYFTACFWVMTVRIVKDSQYGDYRESMFLLIKLVAGGMLLQLIVLFIT